MMAEGVVPTQMGMMMMGRRGVGVLGDHGQGHHHPYHARGAVVVMADRMMVIDFQEP